MSESSLGSVKVELPNQLGKKKKKSELSFFLYKSASQGENVSNLESQIYGLSYIMKITHVVIHV